MSFPKCPLVFTEFNEGDMEDNLRIVEGVAAATDKKLEALKFDLSNELRGEGLLIFFFNSFAARPSATRSAAPSPPAAATRPATTAHSP